MCGNRVEELESRVKELEASVEGLTDELVECKVRIRELEGAFEDELGFVPEPTDTAPPDEQADTEAEMVETTTGETESAEASKSEASEGPDTEPDSDIIIA